uniref:Uncharacterized protein n=1 Tax=Rhizophora mucronata TaxID=61149 RepID=A0A2P2PRX0_RHIMU
MPKGKKARPGDKRQHFSEKEKTINERGLLPLITNKTNYNTHSLNF